MSVQEEITVVDGTVQSFDSDTGNGLVILNDERTIAFHLANFQSIKFPGVGQVVEVLLDSNGNLLLVRIKREKEKSK